MLRRGTIHFPLLISCFAPTTLSEDIYSYVRIVFFKQDDCVTCHTVHQEQKGNNQTLFLFVCPTKLALCCCILLTVQFFCNFISFLPLMGVSSSDYTLTKITRRPPEPGTDWRVVGELSPSLIKNKTSVVVQTNIPEGAPISMFFIMHL